MRAAQLLTVSALGACALVLGVGFLWFFDVLPVTDEAAEAPVVAAAAECDEILTVRAETALNNTFGTDLAAGDEVCIVDDGDQTAVAYTVAGGAPGDRLFSTTGTPTTSGYAQMGFATAP